MEKEETSDILNKLAQIGITPYRENNLIVYKYCSLETALKILKTNSLRFSSPSEFNDPFELSTDLIDKTFTREDLKTLINNSSTLNNKGRRDLLNKNQKNKSSVEYAINTALEGFKRESGVSCFSKSYMKTLMWSHYADKHKGICIGIRLPITLKSMDFVMLSVNYVEKIKPLNYFKNRGEVFFYWAFTKSHIWEYEEEVRGLYIKTNGVIKFDIECIKEIHYGLKTTKDDIKVIEKIVQEKGYKVDKKTRMEINTNTFDLKAILLA